MKEPTSLELAAKRLEGVIEPSRILPGTIILVETVAQVFEFKVDEAGKLWAVGAGKRPFPLQKIDFVGSITQDGKLYSGLIVKDLHMIFRISTGRYTTGCVISASIKGKSYNYEMWSQSRLEQPVCEPLEPDAGDGDAFAGA